MSAPLSPLQTWEQLATGVVAFPAAEVGGRDVVAVTGPDAGSWLQGQLSQDLSGLAPGGSCQALLLAPQGHMVAVLSVGRQAPDRFLLLVDGGHGEAVVERLRRFRLRVKAEVELESRSVVCLRGPGAAAAAEASGGIAAIDAGWGAVGAADVVLEGAGGSGLGLPGGPATGDRGAYEALRIVAGVPLMGREVDAKTIPHSLGAVIERAVSFTKGCYTGQELVARMDARGANVPRSLVAVVAPAGGLAVGDEIFAGTTPVATVTSAGAVPGGPEVGLAFVKRGTAVPGAGSAGEAGAREILIEPLPVSRLLPGR